MSDIASENRMKNPVTECSAPAGSRISKQIPGCYFHDAWRIEAAQPELSALDQFLKATAGTPGWVSVCMNLRNRAVSLFGLKNLGAMRSIAPDKPAGAYELGDRVGIFTLFENDFEEALLGDQDKHLDVMLSVHRAVPDARGAVLVTVTTVVKVHNLLGRLYMLPVTPMHRLIVPSVLRASARA